MSPGEERKAKKYMVKLPNLAKDTNHQIQETVRNPRRISPKLSIPRHIMLNVLKAKDREKKNLQAPREKNNARSIEERMTVDFSSIDLQVAYKSCNTLSNH